MDNLKKISALYGQKNPKDALLKEAFEKNQKQWSVAMKNAERLKAHLDQVPEKWVKYHQQYQEMVNWMDKVDENIKKLFKKTETLDDFNKERQEFQVI